MNMKTTTMILGVLAVSLLLASCPMPSGLSSQLEPTASGAQKTPPPVGIPTIETDAARDQAVFIDEKGTRVDIIGVEADGSIVRCAEAYSATVLEEEAASKSMSPGAARCIVIGRRPDGQAGAWVILSDNSIVPAFSEAEGKETSRLPDCYDRDEGFRAGMGWTYYVTGKASDGRLMIVAGYAKNERGFRHGRWTVEPGTTIGVYWKVLKMPRRPWYSVSRARVIGTLDPEKPAPRSDGHSHGVDPRTRGKLAQLKLFLLDYFKTYLVMTDQDGTAYDAARALFTVNGTDQDGQQAVATIDKKDTITITPVVVTDNPDLTVTAVQAPAAPVSAADTWALGATVTNAGTGDAPATKVTFYLSGDNVFGSDTVIGSSDVPALAVAAAATVTYSTAYSIPGPGTYWIFAVVDPDNTILESSEDNNRASTAVAVMYPRLVIDTYRWSRSGFGTANTFLSLFDRNGDPTADTSPTLWNDDAAPYTVDAPPLSIAEDDDGNPTFAQFARIDYSAGLAPGTYYIRVRGYVSTEVGPYAIRVLTDINPLDQYPVEWFFAGPNYTDAPYETDDNPKSVGVPTNPVAISIGQAHNRYLQAAGDVDWFVLVLP